MNGRVCLALMCFNSPFSSLKVMSRHFLQRKFRFVPFNEALLVEMLPMALFGSVLMRLECDVCELHARFEVPDRQKPRDVDGEKELAGPHRTLLLL